MMYLPAPQIYGSHSLFQHWDEARWPNFSPAELACRCNGRFCDGAYVHDPDFLDSLQALRTQLNKPLHITSAYRCQLWNAHVGGAPMSRHKKLAVDISTHNHDRNHLLQTAKALGFTGIGLAKTFIHLDRRPTPHLWYYKGSYDLWQNL